jgi:pyruvate/2-oxoglutarate dehydrogenase complex dihydrolipoamide dehydrogenase (E3) component
MYRMLLSGGGYVGPEVASALRTMLIDVNVLEGGDRVLKRVPFGPVMRERK